MDELALDVMMLESPRFSSGGVPGGAAGVVSGSSGSDGTAVRTAVVAVVGVVLSTTFILACGVLSSKPTFPINTTLASLESVLVKSKPSVKSPTLL